MASPLAGPASTPGSTDGEASSGRFSPQPKRPRSSSLDAATDNTDLNQQKTPKKEEKTPEEKAKEDLPQGPRFTGQGFYVTRLQSEAQPGQRRFAPPGLGDVTVSLPELLEPITHLQRAILVTGKADPVWMTTLGGLANLPGTLADRPLLIYHEAVGDVDVEQTLNSASPALVAANKPWLVLPYRGRGGTSLHANLFLLRFRADKEAGRPAFLRVCVGSAGLNDIWGHARDEVWVQDFPVNDQKPKDHDQEPLDHDQEPLEPLPPIEQDGTPRFRRMLRAFFASLAPAVGVEQAPQPDLSVLLAACLMGIDLTEARATLLLSIPERYRRHLTRGWVGIRGLGSALFTQKWPVEAWDAPVNVLTGVLGNPANQAWMDSVAWGTTAAKTHRLLADRRIRIIFPTTATVFGSDATVRDRIQHSSKNYKQRPFPAHLFWNAEAKPGSWPADSLPPLHHGNVIWRVAPAGLGRGRRPELRGWLVLGSHNFSKAAWGHPLLPNTAINGPDNFELSILLCTRDPARAAAWLDRLPVKLPPGASRTGLEAVQGQPAKAYPRSVDVHLQPAHPNAPFTFGRVTDPVRLAAAEQIALGGAAGGDV